MVYNESTTLRRVYFSVILALLIHDIPLRNIVEPLNIYLLSYDHVRLFKLPNNISSSILQCFPCDGGRYFNQFSPSALQTPQLQFILGNVLTQLRGQELCTQK